ncbi:hypothetical protein I7I50_12414 [Histoplasma capsulatum G186AR]|uniref:Uncharacterized protein n=1 Tax=Ajellomyces capsulatus TaxID=5037 RepID=A0A8H7YA36_AJECA|nr:hypothetical protein I7I52_11279 [Histoplasma capsulatum]QSS70691.1 hypothetical protein I7I50_12414 [Histoplasma capsulatum G186AR]
MSRGEGRGRDKKNVLRKRLLEDQSGGWLSNELVQSNAVGRLFCFSLPRTQVKGLYEWAGQPFPGAFALELRHHRGPEQSMSPEEGREEK